eukprot:maker-scaffold_13-snap-gene-1.51-mRNA-1 protein AED:0.00 eAED:0.00 QI:36/1/1/1/1/1/2/1222/123
MGESRQETEELIEYTKTLIRDITETHNQIKYYTDGSPYNHIVDNVSHVLNSFEELHKRADTSQDITIPTELLSLMDKDRQTSASNPKLFFNFKKVSALEEEERIRRYRNDFDTLKTELTREEN